MNNLIKCFLIISFGLSIGCNSPEGKTKAAPKAKLNTNLTGTWKWMCCDDTSGGVLELVQKGDTITGNFILDKAYNQNSRIIDTTSIKGQYANDTLTFYRKRYRQAIEAVNISENNLVGALYGSDKKKHSFKMYK